MGVLKVSCVSQYSCHLGSTVLNGYAVGVGGDRRCCVQSYLYCAVGLAMSDDESKSLDAFERSRRGAKLAVTRSIMSQETAVHNSFIGLHYYQSTRNQLDNSYM